MIIVFVKCLEKTFEQPKNLKNKHIIVCIFQQYLIAFLHRKL